MPVRDGARFLDAAIRSVVTDNAHGRAGGAAAVTLRRIAFMATVRYRELSARPAGFEPAAFRSGGGRSIH